MALQTFEMYVAPALATIIAAHTQRPSLHSMPDSAPRAARSDADLLAAMARGEEAAAAALYDRHAPTLMAVAFRMIRERADAESVVLEAFMQAWRDASRFDATRGSAISWLLTIARTRALDFVRSAGRQAKRTPASVDDVPAELLTAPERAGHPGFDAEHNEQQRAVAVALRALPDNQRVAIELAFYEGLSHAEVADKLGEPLGTVKTRIRLGMLKLRDTLRPFRGEAVS